VSSRAELYALIDALPEEALPTVARYLETIRAGAPLDEDEEISPEEQAMIDASRAAIARGEVVSHEEMLARRAARRDQH
jgi:hypothetical protein